MSSVEEYFKGAPGGGGRPGRAGFNGMKGAVTTFLMPNRLIPIMSFRLYSEFMSMFCACR